MNNQINYPLLDGSYLYDKINKKIEDGKDINVYEQFYLWSIENRSNVLYGLFIILIITIVVNDIIEYRNNKIIIKSGTMIGGFSNPFSKDARDERYMRKLQKKAEAGNESASKKLGEVHSKYEARQQKKDYIAQAEDKNAAKANIKNMEKQEQATSQAAKLDAKAEAKTYKVGYFGNKWNKFKKGVTGVASDIGSAGKSLGKGVKNVVVGKNTGEDMNKFAKGAAKVRSAFTKNIAFGKRDPSKMSQYELERYQKLEETKANRKYKKLGAIKDFATFFPLIDKFFSKIWNVVWNTKAGIIVGFILLVYGFGAVVIPLLILYLLIKYTLKIFKNKTRSIQNYNRYKKILKQQQK